MISSVRFVVSASHDRNGKEYTVFRCYFRTFTFKFREGERQDKTKIVIGKRELKIDRESVWNRKLNSVKYESNKQTENASEPFIGP